MNCFLFWRNSRRAVIYKVWGSVDRFKPNRSSFVITDTDLIHLVAGMLSDSVIPVVFLEALLSRSLLFLGLDISDWVQRAIVYCFRGGQRLNSHSWVVMLNPSPLDLFFWQKLDADVFNLRIPEFVETLKKQA